MALLIGLLVFIVGFLGVLGVAVLMGAIKHPLDERLDRIQDFNPKKRQINKEINVIQKDEQKGMMATLGHHVAPEDEKQRSQSKKQLTMAGFYSDQAYYTFWGVKIILTLSLPVLTYFMCILNALSWKEAAIPSVLAVVIGLMLPDFFLWWRKRNRHEQIFCGLPDALDLLVVCIEAGLGLDAALQKVSEEFHLSNPVLSSELNLTCSSIRMGQPRHDALHDLGERTGVMDLKSLVAVLIQADRFGTSMAQTLRVHSDDMRTRRRQRAEELAAKTTVKLIFPLVFFIFPAIFVVLAGPAVLKIMDGFIKPTM